MSVNSNSGAGVLTFAITGQTLLFVDLANKRKWGKRGYDRRVRWSERKWKRYELRQSLKKQR